MLIFTWNTSKFLHAVTYSVLPMNVLFKSIFWVQLSHQWEGSYSVCFCSNPKPTQFLFTGRWVGILLCLYLHFCSDPKQLNFHMCGSYFVSLSTFCLNPTVIPNINITTSLFAPYPTLSSLLFKSKRNSIVIYGGSKKGGKPIIHYVSIHIYMWHEIMKQDIHKVPGYTWMLDASTGCQGAFDMTDVPMVLLIWLMHPQGARLYFMWLMHLQGALHIAGSPNGCQVLFIWLKHHRVPGSISCVQCTHWLILSLLFFQIQNQLNSHLGEIGSYSVSICTSTYVQIPKQLNSYLWKCRVIFCLHLHFCSNPSATQFLFIRGGGHTLFPSPLLFKSEINSIPIYSERWGSYSVSIHF